MGLTKTFEVNVSKNDNYETNLTINKTELREIVMFKKCILIT